METVLYDNYYIRNDIITKKKYNCNQQSLLIMTGVYAVLLFGAYLNNVYIKIFGVAISLFLMIVSNQKKAYDFLAFLTPNLMLLSYKNDGFGLIILCYFIAFGKLIIKKRIPISSKYLLFTVILLMITSSRIINSNMHDVVLLSGILSSIYLWINYIYNSSIEEKKNVVLFFSYGTMCLLFGMVYQYYFVNGMTRFEGFLDDSNYTSAVFAVVISVMLYFIVNKVNFKYKYIFLFFSLIGGLITGSRGFLVTLASILIIYYFCGIFHKKYRKVFHYSFIIAILIVFLFILHFGPIVNLYEKTIGRTIELKNNYSKGNFMDITSGRLFLWKYYLNIIFSNSNLLLFGSGFNKYHLIENGGYGLVAHNSLISGLMGFGIIGTISIIFLFFGLFRGKKIYIIDLSLIVSFLIPYMFIEGILDFRLTLYMAITSIAMTIKQSV